MTDESDPKGAEIVRELESALSEIIARLDGAMVTKWVTVVEVISGEDGQRGRWTLAAEESPLWETVDLLRYASLIEEAKLTEAATRPDTE
jgi:hypothetical protein